MAEGHPDEEAAVTVGEPTPLRNIVPFALRSGPQAVGEAECDPESLDVRLVF